MTNGDLIPGADLGFYKGGCPIHLKGHRRSSAEGAKWRWVLGRGQCPEPDHFCISYIKMASFYAFPVIFIDTVTFKKGILIKRAGVRTPWTPPGSATED